MKEKTRKVFDFVVSWAAKIIILAVIVYILFSIGRSIWKNWQVNQKIKNYENSIKTLEEQNNYLKNQLVYMQTDVFKELEARSRLGLKKPDEKMILIPENASSTKTPAPKNNNSENGGSSENLPNPSKWWKYILGK
ncbi:MAG: septum formation initiator family protein [Patescibacteria group bacterium]|nr:septum formation initiator family protein [Patescibacteria group bacterium]